MGREVETNKGTGAMNGVDSRANLYSTQALSGQRGEEPNAAIGMATGS